MAQNQLTIVFWCRYPVKINRSTVISCGSKSNWPKNLGALHFLLELNTLKDTVDINSQIFGCGLGDGGFEEGQQTKARHNQLMFQYAIVTCSFEIMLLILPHPCPGTTLKHIMLSLKGTMI